MEDRGVETGYEATDGDNRDDADHYEAEVVRDLAASFVDRTGEHLVMAHSERPAETGQAPWPAVGFHGHDWQGRHDGFLSRGEVGAYGSVSD